MDFQNIVLGKKTMYLNAYNKSEKILMIMSFFGMREWNFQNENIRRLTNETKKFKFNHDNMDFDIKNIDWSEYFANYIPGIKRYFFKENCENVEKLQISYERLRKIHNFLKYLIYVIFAGKMCKSLANYLSGTAFRIMVKWIENVYLLASICRGEGEGGDGGWMTFSSKPIHLHKPSKTLPKLSTSHAKKVQRNDIFIFSFFPTTNLKCSFDFYIFITFSKNIFVYKQEWKQIEFSSV